MTKKYGPKDEWKSDNDIKFNKKDVSNETPMAEVEKIISSLKD